MPEDKKSRLSLVKKRPFLSIFVLLIVVLAGCLPESTVPRNKEDIRVVEGQLGDRKLFVPQKYFRLRPNFSNGTISLQMSQPYFTPLSKPSSRMWKDGERTNYLLVLIHTIRSPNSFDKDIKMAVDHLKASEIVGSEYGLIHLKQPDEEVQDFWDVWLEKNEDKNISYITCSEKIIKADVPQCTHSFLAEGLYVTIDYDKQNLPDWKKIQSGVTSVIQSFQSLDAAQNALFQKYNDSQKGD